MKVKVDYSPNLSQFGCKLYFKSLTFKKKFQI